MDALVDATYVELQNSVHWASAGGAQGELLSGYADGAMIPSTFVQALQSLFRFREPSTPGSPLASPIDYELLRSYMASGEEIATTMYGAVRFDESGGPRLCLVQSRATTRFQLEPIWVPPARL